MQQAIIAVDIGTSQIKAMLYAPQTGQVVRQTERSTTSCQIQGLSPNWSEADPIKIVALAQEAISEIRADVPANFEAIAITFTGAMHGILLVDKSGQPLTNLIDWRDRRAIDPIPILKTTALEHLSSRYQAEWIGLQTGCHLAAGYGLSSLYWLALNQALPPVPAQVRTIVDFVAWQVTGQPVSPDYSLTASTGLYSLTQWAWCQEFIADFGATQVTFPEAVPSGTLVGSWKGMTILSASGDHAAAVYAVLKDRTYEAHINIGTGSQVAINSSVPHFDIHIETRMGFTKDYLLVSAGAVGGHTLDILAQMLSQLIPDLAQPPAVNDILWAAEAVPQGCEGLRMQPVFSGTRAKPNQRGLIEGIGPTNFSLSHLSRACLEGIATEWVQDLTQLCQLTDQSFHKVFLSGRLATERPIFQQIVREALQVEIEVVQGSDVSMLGAAQHAAKQLNFGERETDDL